MFMIPTVTVKGRMAASCAKDGPHCGRPSLYINDWHINPVCHPEGCLFHIIR